MKQVNEDTISSKVAQCARARGTRRKGTPFPIRFDRIEAINSADNMIFGIHGKPNTDFNYSKGSDVSRSIHNFCLFASFTFHSLCVACVNGKSFFQIQTHTHCGCVCEASDGYAFGGICDANADALMRRHSLNRVNSILNHVGSTHSELIDDRVRTWFIRSSIW